MDLDRIIIVDSTCPFFTRQVCRKDFETITLSTDARTVKLGIVFAHMKNMYTLSQACKNVNYSQEGNIQEP